MCCVKNTNIEKANGKVTRNVRERNFNAEKEWEGRQNDTHTHTHMIQRGDGLATNLQDSLSSKLSSQPL